MRERKRDRLGERAQMREAGDLSHLHGLYFSVKDGGTCLFTINSTTGTFPVHSDMPRVRELRRKMMDLYLK